LALAAALLGCAGKPAPMTASELNGYAEKGIASWYGKKYHGRRTANGERYDMHAMTAAHKKLPFGTLVLVKNLENGKKARVRINDRGPFKKGRIIDLSYAAARELGMVHDGLAKVRIKVVDRR
jgi:rare lipoprotein A